MRCPTFTVQSLDRLVYMVELDDNPLARRRWPQTAESRGVEMRALIVAIDPPEIRKRDASETVH